MANTSIDAYDSVPVRGNYTNDVDGHLWCANALAIMVANPSTPLEELNDDAQESDSLPAVDRDCASQARLRRGSEVMTIRRTLNEVLADAFALSKTDREYLERYMRASRVAGLDLSPSSVRTSSDDDVRQLFDGGKIAGGTP